MKQENYKEFFGDSIEIIDTNIGKIKVFKNASSILLGTHIVLSVLSGVALVKDPKLSFSVLTTFNLIASSLHGSCVLGTKYLLNNIENYREEFVSSKNKILKK